MYTNAHSCLSRSFRNDKKAALGAPPLLVVKKLLLSFLVLLFADRDRLAYVADFEAGEAADGDVFSQLADFAGDELVHGDAGLFHEGLFEKTNLFVEL